MPLVEALVPSPAVNVPAIREVLFYLARHGRVVNPNALAAINEVGHPGNDFHHYLNGGTQAIRVALQEIVVSLTRQCHQDNRDRAGFADVSRLTFEMVFAKSSGLDGLHTVFLSRTRRSVPVMCADNGIAASRQSRTAPPDTASASSGF
ncbi:hypothetical protein K8374_12040 [Pseudomonas sp. p1(2021b)]|nr:hypothetical protein [Pseudomonas sp. p1(2021b)]UBM23143.1 hypothetical protein K8374_12040 [Pseudomonas sp. p1(2021b)]